MSFQEFYNNKIKKNLEFYEEQRHKKLLHLKLCQTCQALIILFVLFSMILSVFTVIPFQRVLINICIGGVSIFVINKYSTYVKTKFENEIKKTFLQKVFDYFGKSKSIIKKTRNADLEALKLAFESTKNEKNVFFDFDSTLKSTIDGVVVEVNCARKETVFHRNVDIKNTSVSNSDKIAGILYNNISNLIKQRLYEYATVVSFSIGYDIVGKTLITTRNINLKKIKSIDSDFSQIKLANDTFNELFCLYSTSKEQTKNILNKESLNSLINLRNSNRMDFAVLFDSKKLYCILFSEIDRAFWNIDSSFVHQDKFADISSLLSFAFEINKIFNKTEKMA